MNNSVPAFSIRNVNVKRGGTCAYHGRDSGPMGLSHLNESSIRDSNDISESDSSPNEDLNYRSMIVESDCVISQKDIPTNITLAVDREQLVAEEAERAVTCSAVRARAVEQVCRVIAGRR